MGSIIIKDGSVTISDDILAVYPGATATINQDGSVSVSGIPISDIIEKSISFDVAPDSENVFWKSVDVDEALKIQFVDGTAYINTLTGCLVGKVCSMDGDLTIKPDSLQAVEDAIYPYGVKINIASLFSQYVDGSITADQLAKDINGVYSALGYTGLSADSELASIISSHTVEEYASYLSGGSFPSVDDVYAAMNDTQYGDGIKTIAYSDSLSEYTLSQSNGSVVYVHSQQPLSDAIKAEISTNATSVSLDTIVKNFDCSNAWAQDEIDITTSFGVRFNLNFRTVTLTGYIDGGTTSNKMLALALYEVLTHFTFIQNIIIIDNSDLTVFMEYVPLSDDGEHGIRNGGAIYGSRGLNDPQNEWIGADQIEVLEEFVGISSTVPPGECNTVIVIKKIGVKHDVVLSDKLLANIEYLLTSDVNASALFAPNINVIELRAYLSSGGIGEKNYLYYWGILNVRYRYLEATPVVGYHDLLATPVAKKANVIDVYDYKGSLDGSYIDLSTVKPAFVSSYYKVGRDVYSLIKDPSKIINLYGSALIRISNNKASMVDEDTNLPDGLAFWDSEVLDWYGQGINKFNMIPPEASYALSLAGISDVTVDTQVSQNEASIFAYKNIPSPDQNGVLHMIDYLPYTDYLWKHVYVNGVPLLDANGMTEMALSKPQLVEVKSDFMIRDSDKWFITEIAKKFVEIVTANSTPITDDEYSPVKADVIRTYNPQVYNTDENDSYFGDGYVNSFKYKAFHKELFNGKGLIRLIKGDTLTFSIVPEVLNGEVYTREQDYYGDTITVEYHDVMTIETEYEISLYNEMVSRTHLKSNFMGDICDITNSGEVLEAQVLSKLHSDFDYDSETKFIRCSYCVDKSGSYEKFDFVFDVENMNFKAEQFRGLPTLEACNQVGIEGLQEPVYDTKADKVEYSFTDNGDGSVTVTYMATDKDGNDITDRFSTITLEDTFMHKSIDGGNA